MLNEQQLQENLALTGSAASTTRVESDSSPMEERGLRFYDLIKYRLDFAQRCFTNNQDLVRFMDQKTGLILSAVGLLTTAQSALMVRALNAVPVLPWQIAARVLIGACVLAYMLIAFGVITAGVSVFIPLAGTRRRDTRAPGFLFPLAILDQHGGSPDLYRDRLMQAMPSQLLDDLADQVVEIASIYKNKNIHLQVVIRRFRWLSMMWAANMMLLAASAFLS